MTAHERAHRAADGPIANRFPDVGELGVEPLRVADGELQLALARQSDEFVGFGEFQGNRLLEKDMLAGDEAIARHREVRGFRRGGDIHRVDLGDAEQLAIIGHCGAGIGRLRHFRQALRKDLRQMQVFHQRVRGARLRANAAAPAGADDADIDLLHCASLLLTIDQRCRKGITRATRGEMPAQHPH